MTTRNTLARYYVFNGESGKVEGYFDTHKRYPPEHTNFTAVAPPSDVPAGHIACFDRAKQEWEIVKNMEGVPITRTRDGYVLKCETPRVPEGWTDKPRPSPYHRWTGEDWSDAGMENEKRGDMPWFTRGQFLIALKRAGKLTVAQAKAAATGSVPANAAAALARLPKDARDEAEIEWLGASHVGRLSPLTKILLDGMTEEEMDAFFESALQP